jgi:hypothetical protein
MSPSSYSAQDPGRIHETHISFSFNKKADYQKTFTFVVDKAYVTSNSHLFGISLFLYIP